MNFKEVKLLILFYDQDHDFALTYGDLFKIIHPGKEFPKLKYIHNKELNHRVDNKLYNLLEQEILLARTISALLDEIKHKQDFDIHSAFHALKYYACITGDSINLFLKNCGMDPTAGDIKAIVKRLDINKDEIIDFCEFHAFLGYPDCSFCCPCFPCPNCGIKYCEECLRDIPCYILGCDHKGMDSKMRCTSIEHNPHIGQMNSFLNNSRSPNSLYNTRFSQKQREEENEKNDINSNYGIRGSKFNSGKYPGNLSPEQYNLLQGLTNPEQLNKFMAINNILDRQNSEGINLTKNLSLRLCPLRDFDPKNWGCKNCPCNIHSNPNVPCDCCTCNICPNKEPNNSNINKEKIKQKKFPKINLYSYTYTYEPEVNNGNNDIIYPLNKLNYSGYTNSPMGKNSPYYNKDTNKFGRTMANSSDDEKEYGRSKKNFYDNINNNNQLSPNDMIYNDQMNNMNKEDMNRNNINDINENEQNIDIRNNKLILNKTYKNEENIINENQRRKYGNQNDEQNNNENEGEREEEQNENNRENNNQNINNNENIDNYYKTFSPNNENNRENPFNRNNNPQNNNIPEDIMYRTSPDNFNIGKNKNPLVDSLGFKLTKNIRLNDNKSNINNKNSKISPEEESEDELYTSKNNFLNKSRDEILDIEEQKFLTYLKSLIKSEKEIEFARRDLMRQKDFNGEDAFRLFEIQGTGVVTRGDLIFGLKLLGIKPTEKQLTILFNIYDLDGNGVLNYSDFFDMVISYKDQDRKEEERRRPNRRISNRNINIFSERTKELYKKLFLVIIEEEERMEDLKQKLEINDDLIMGIFNRINVDKDWICDKYEFVNYCLKNKVCKEKKDAYLAFIKLNKKRDGGLDIKDISVGLKSSFFGK